MAINLYLDTNVYLSFYHLSNDDLEELEKLLILVKTKEITLHLPEQTRNEFIRNRDVKIADAINRFKENKLTNVFPQICKDYDVEYEAMREAIKSYDKNKQHLIEHLQKDIRSNSLKADKVIDALFTNAKLFPTSDEIYFKAKKRYDLGNPPGKKNSLGDAVNWQVLLESVDDFTDLYFISDDKDYYSEFDSSLFNPFLLSEWKQSRFDDLKYYRKLSVFLKEKYPNIVIATEYEKDSLINDLQFSSSFSSTRSILRRLNEFDGFTNQQLTDIANATITNSQIYWIATDWDINQYINNLLFRNKKQLDKALLEQVMAISPLL
jgi:predicted nucleic acid-binding protein